MASPLTRAVSDPLYGPPAAPGRQLHHCEIGLDTAARRITWLMEERTAHEELVAELPA
ncbi:hypothetical protein ABZT02_10995 [Streptomyces sp. NPDC005402]|uniref:hypothetical protein n=1 Tax=Streptomyces sp. NPDC005402 TaxID=3155338 RepID=UPI0033A9846C